MSSEQIAPPDWNRMQFETDPFEAKWKSPDGKVIVSARYEEHGDDPEMQSSYPVVVEQYVESDPYWTTIQTDVDLLASREEALDYASDLMTEIGSDDGRLRVLGHEEWRENVNFYCINDSELPGDLTADQLIDAVDQEAMAESDSNDDVSQVDVQVDVYPRHESVVGRIDDE
jgi:hypothetical protein